MKDFLKTWWHLTASAPADLWRLQEPWMRFSYPFAIAFVWVFMLVLFILGGLILCVVYTFNRAW